MSPGNSRSLHDIRDFAVPSLKCHAAALSRSLPTQGHVHLGHRRDIFLLVDLGVGLGNGSATHEEDALGQ